MIEKQKSKTFRAAASAISQHFPGHTHTDYEDAARDVLAKLSSPEPEVLEAMMHAYHAEWGAYDGMPPVSTAMMRTLLATAVNMVNQESPTE